jgi:hypothetical protein
MDPIDFKIKIHAFGGILTRNSTKRAVADPRHRPLDHRDQLTMYLAIANRRPCVYVNNSCTLLTQHRASNFEYLSLEVTSKAC